MLKTKESLNLEEVLFARDLHLKSHDCGCVWERCERCQEFEQMLGDLDLQPA
jgi:hypothetical protein